MRGHVLRFPVGRQFQKILEDDHEWYVVTDMHLKVIAAGRGEQRHVPNNIIDTVYKEVFKKYRGAREGSIRVYDLHTHPEVHYYPSPGDLGRSVEDRVLHRYGIIHAGFGVITKDGIFIWKLPENQKKLARLNNVGDTFTDNIRDNAEEYFGPATSSIRKKMIDHDEKTTRHGAHKIINRIAKKSFESVQEDEPGIRSRTVRRNTFRTRVRR
jgi:hypothetical protein